MPILGIVASAKSKGPAGLPNLHSWYDAADATTIISSSGKVSQWNDKSGNSRNLTQGTGANQPGIGTTTQNGKNVITFNGTNQMMFASASVTSNALTFFTVYKRDSGGVTYGRLLSLYRNTGNDYDNTDSIVVQASALSSPPNINAYRASAQITPNSNISYGVAYSASMTLNGTAVSLNNSGTITTGTTSATSLNANAITMGAGGPSGGGDQYLNGWIAEHIIYTRVLSASEITLIRNYLSSKWGV